MDEDELEEPTPLEEAFASDRRWFRSHPNAKCLYRELVEGELEDMRERRLGRLVDAVVELAELLNSDQWRVRVIVCIIQLRAHACVALPALEVSNSRQKRNCLLWKDEHGHFREVSVEHIADGLRDRLGPYLDSLKTAQIQCEGCGAVPPLGAVLAQVGRKIYCPDCIIDKVKRGMKVESVRVSLVSEDGKINDEVLRIAEEFRRELERLEK